MHRNNELKILRVNPEKCVGCGLCAGHCPVGAITLYLNKARIDIARCIECEKCLMVCPYQAVEKIVMSKVIGIRMDLKHLKQKINLLKNRLTRYEDMRKKV